MSDDLVEQVKLGNQRGLYDTSKMGPELVAYLDDRAGMLEGLRDEMSEGYRGWLDDAVEALRTAAKRCAEVASQPDPAKPHCATCGKDVAEVQCPECGKWWADNQPVPASSDLVVAAAAALKDHLLRREGLALADSQLHDAVRAIIPIIQADERESCAKACDSLAKECEEECDFGPSREPESCYRYAATAIRERNGHD